MQTTSIEENLRHHLLPHSLNPEPLHRELQSLFQLFDGDDDGSISPQEVERILANLAEVILARDAETLRRLVQERGRLSFEQFATWALQQLTFDVINNLRELFALIDSDGNGSLCAEEIGVMLQLLDRDATPERISAFMAEHDRNGSGSICLEEFIQLLGDGSSLTISLADLKRLKKTFVHYSSAARSRRIGLVEVDCDLGAGIPGAGSGIEMLKQAARRQEAMRQLGEALIEEISSSRRPIRAQAAPAPGGGTTPHARHIANIARVMAEAAELVCEIRRRGLFPVVLAGDHSTAAGTIAGLRRAHPESRIGVVWIDAHADLHSPYTTPSGNMHGMPLAIAARHDNLAHAINTPDANTLELWRSCQDLVGEGKAAIGFDDLIYISLRDTEPAEQATVMNHGIPVVSTELVRQIGPEAAATHCLEHLADCDLIYVSFDVDSMDATICKGTGTPVAGGLWADEAQRINATLLADPRVACWEICEINPHLDTLNSLAEVSLGVYQAVLEVLNQRL